MHYIGVDYHKRCSYVVVKNAGNGPAIELEIALLDKNKSLLEAHRETYLRLDEEIDFGDLAIAHLEESTYIDEVSNQALITVAFALLTDIPRKVLEGCRKALECRNRIMHGEASIISSQDARNAITNLDLLMSNEEIKNTLNRKSKRAKS